jgi:hypothetical protein
MLSITQEQRDALLLACDDRVRYVIAAESKPEMPALGSMPIVEALADDLILADADGRYEIRSLDREDLIAFLEHELQSALEYGTQDELLRIWHTCVTLLDQLGHEVEGSIYDRIVCGCAACERDRERCSKFEARTAGITDDDEMIEICREIIDEEEEEED